MSLLRDKKREDVELSFGRGACCLIFPRGQGYDQFSSEREITEKVIYCSGRAKPDCARGSIERKREEKEKSREREG